MKEISIIIPTRNRHEKLCNCLKSIPEKILDIQISPIIVCDGDPETAKKLVDNPKVKEVIYVKGNRGIVYCRNLVTPTVEDALIYATDDIVFQPESIAEVVKSMKQHFPDEDGIIGFHIENAPSFCIAGVSLIGQSFLKRYPGKKLFFPKYFHFSCQEIERLGTKLGKIHSEKKARILHYHPAFYRDEIDRTHEEARKHRQRDKALSINRKEKGLIWGDGK